MRKLFLSLIALTLGIGAWAQETQSVNYIDADGQQKTVTATVVTNETGTLSGWNVVLGSDVQTGTLVCNGAVNLILADGAKLTATGNNQSNTPGIEVSGEDKSLVIYGQTAQTGQLIATGEYNAAGIGGEFNGSGSYITINGGSVTAIGGEEAAGIGGGSHASGSNITINGGNVTATGGNFGAGIGGGLDASGSNITINGGTVTATGGDYAAGIGGGAYSSGYDITINGGKVSANGAGYVASIGSGFNGHVSRNIKVSADCQVLADDNCPPTTEIQHDSDTDLTSSLESRYALIEIAPDILLTLRNEAISAIDEVIGGVGNAVILGIAQIAKNQIMNANGRMIITRIKDAALAVLETAVRWYNSILGPLGEEHPGPAVKVTKDDTEVILYLPDKVEYIIRK